MGPLGGDELNRIEAGANYGWPVVSWGINYDGVTIPSSALPARRHDEGGASATPAEPLAHALEQRVMLDAALVATVVEGADAAQPAPATAPFSRSTEAASARNVALRSA